MQAITLDRPLSQIFLSLVPFLIFGSALVRGLRRPIVYPLVVGVMFAAIVVAAWRLGASAIAGSDDRKGLALAGILLIAPWAVLSVLVGLGAPWQATEAENRLRFEALLVARILIPMGLIVLSQVLREAGERFYSMLGFAAMMLAGPLMLIFGTFPMTVQLIARHQQVSSGQEPNWLSPLISQAALIDCLEVVLTYLTVTAFATALLKLGWLGRKTSRAFVGVGLFAALCVTVAAAVFIQLLPQELQFATLRMKVAIVPGFILGIPAIPFIMPHLIGVNLLRRASERTVTR